MSLLYTLGWPGLLNLPCVIVDHVTREVYSPEHKLPLSKIHLNTTNNKYVELAAVLRKFPPGKDKDAMHSFMSISSDFGMRKFFMDRHQRAYISLDTLLVYMVVYPFCPEFVQARADVTRYLQTYREIPCLRCGFIHRNCRCSNRESEAEEFDIVGFASEQMDRQCQTEATRPPSPPLPKTPLPQPTVLHSSSVPVPVPSSPHVQNNQPPGPPLQSILNSKNQMPTGASSAISKVNPMPITGIAAPMIGKEKQTTKPPPINIVTPMITKPLMVDAGCQTRANFDFSMKKRAQNNWEKSDAATGKDGSLTPGADQPGVSLLRPGTGSVPGTPVSLPLPVLNPGIHTIGQVPRQAVKISLWKLLDSDSSSDEDDATGGKKKKKKKDNTDSTVKGDKDKDKFKAPLPKSLDFSGEEMETNTTEKLTEEEKLMLQEAEKIAPVEEKLAPEEEKKTAPEESDKKEGGADGDTTQSKNEGIDETQKSADGNTTQSKNEGVDETEKSSTEDVSVEKSADTVVDSVDEKVLTGDDKLDDSVVVEDEKVENNNVESNQHSIESKEGEDDKSEVEIKEGEEDKSEVASNSEKPAKNNDTETPMEMSMFEALDTSKHNESMEVTTTAEEKVTPVPDDSMEKEEGNTKKEEVNIEGSSSDDDVICISDTADSSPPASPSKTTTTNNAVVNNRDDSASSKADIDPVESNKQEEEQQQDNSSLSLEDKLARLESRMTGVIDSVTKKVVMEAEEALKNKSDSVLVIEDGEGGTERSRTEVHSEVDKDKINKDIDNTVAKLIYDGKRMSKTAVAMETLDFFHKQTVITTSKEGYNSTDAFNYKQMTHHLNKSGADSEPGTSGTDKDGLVPNKSVCQEEVFHIKSSAGTDDDKNEENDKKDTTEDKNKKEEDKVKKDLKKPDKFQNFKKWCHKFEYTPTGEKIFRCTFARCGQCFDTKKSAVVHDKVHGSFGKESATLLQCYKCEYTTGLNKWFDMVRHLKHCHNELITSTEFGCFLCGRDFPDIESVNRHIDFHYSGRYKCVQCGNILFTWKQVQEHLKDTCDSKDKKDKHLGCPYCPLVFHIRNMRNAHMLSHQDKGLVCAFCENEDIWENWKLLRKHYQQKHGEKIKSYMNPCKKMNLNRPALDPKKTPALKPLKIDIKKNPICPVCEAEFIVLEDFEYHMRKKHDYIPYTLTVCEMCEKSFKTMKMYEWHMRNTHGDDIKCDQCDFVAKTQLMMKVHQQNKHVVKEHVCSECNKEFEHYHQLRMHMARHALHTIYCCPVCQEEFKRQKELRAHVNIVHPKNDSQPNQTCPDCDYSCFTKRAMEAHIKKYHPRLAEEIEDSENAVPLYKPEHSYFTAAATAKHGGSYYPMGPPAPKPPRPQPPPAPSTSAGDGEGRLVIRLPKNISKKYSKHKKSKKRRLSSHSDEPREVSEEVLEKRRIKRDHKENLDRLKILSKETCARTRTHEDFLAMKQLTKPKEKPKEKDAHLHQTTSHDADTHTTDEPDAKRPRISKYGRSITTKELDDIYVPSVKFYNDQGNTKETSEAAQFKIEKQKRADVIKRQRLSVGLYGVAPPDTWEDEDVIIDYPYNDHCYFLIEHAHTIPNQPTPAARSNRRYSSTEAMIFGDGEIPTVLGTPGGSTPINIHNVDIVGGPPQAAEFEEIGVAGGIGAMSTLRIGPGGLKKTPAGSAARRKQKIQYRDGIDMTPPPPQQSARGGFMPLSPSYGQNLVVQQEDNIGGLQPQPQYPSQSADYQEEIIEQELMREVTEIAQKDPVLQDLINSMQQTAGTGAALVVPSSPLPGGGQMINLQQQHQQQIASSSSNYPYSQQQNSTSTFNKPGYSAAIGSQQPSIIMRNAIPPKSLDISMQGDEETDSTNTSLDVGGGGYNSNNSPSASALATPTKHLLSASQSIGTGLTPTKQNVLDFLLKQAGSGNGTELEDIDLNEDELKQLLDEHNRSVAGHISGTGGGSGNNSVGGSQDGDNSQDSMDIGVLGSNKVSDDGDQEAVDNAGNEQEGMVVGGGEVTDDGEIESAVNETEQTTVQSEEQVEVHVGHTEEAVVVGGTEDDTYLQQGEDVQVENEQHEAPIMDTAEHTNTTEVILDNSQLADEASYIEQQQQQHTAIEQQQPEQIIQQDGDEIASITPLGGDVSTSSNRQKVYRVVYQQPDGQSVVKTVVGDDSSGTLSIPAQVEMPSADEQDVVYMDDGQATQAQDSTGISALIAASELREQQEENVTAVSSITMDTKVEQDQQQFEEPQQQQQISQEEPQQFHYVNQQGEIVNMVHIPDIPESGSMMMQQQEVTEAAAVIEQSQFIETAGQEIQEVQYMNTQEEQPQMSSPQIINHSDGTVTIVSGGPMTTEAGSSGIQLLSSTQQALGQTSLVKQVLQEPASQYRTVSVPGRGPVRTTVGTQGSKLSAVRVIRGKPGQQTSLLNSNQTRQSLVIRQPHQQQQVIRHLRTGRPGTMNMNSILHAQPRVQHSAPPQHRIMRMTSPSQIIQNQNQTKIIKLASSNPGSSVSGSPAISFQQQTLTRGGNRIVSMPGSAATVASSTGGQSFVRVVQRPPPNMRLGRGRGVRPALTMYRAPQGGAAGAPRVVVRARGPVVTSAAGQLVTQQGGGAGGSGITMVRLESDGRGGQRILHVPTTQNTQQ